jgi:hypothetical protein
MTTPDPRAEVTAATVLHASEALAYMATLSGDSLIPTPDIVAELRRAGLSLSVRGDAPRHEPKPRIGMTSPQVAGRCPACRHESLFLAEGGHLTCDRLACPNPTAADELLHGERPTTPAPATTGAARPVYAAPDWVGGFACDLQPGETFAWLSAAAGDEITIVSLIRTGNTSSFDGSVHIVGKAADGRLIGRQYPATEPVAVRAATSAEAAPETVREDSDGTVILDGHRIGFSKSTNGTVGWSCDECQWVGSGLPGFAAALAEHARIAADIAAGKIPAGPATADEPSGPAATGPETIIEAADR